MRQYLSTLWSWLLPARCLLCRRGGDYLCLSCIYTLPPASPSPGGPASDTPVNTLALYDYQHPAVKKIIWSLKYRQLKGVAPILGRLLADRLIEETAELQNLHPAITLPWLIVPIPLSKKRQRDRGFNQSLLLAGALEQCYPKVFRASPGVLKKIRETPAQASLKDRKTRLTNLRGAFALREPESIRGRAVIIVDDVSTTGATMHEAEQTLRPAKPRLILKVALAQG